jgi:hypothetical protein
METNETPKQDCSCDPNCCPPKRKPKWMVIISGLVILAALAIIAIKLIGGHTATPAGDPASSSGKAACCDTAKTSGCDTTKNSSCCPK